MDISTSCSPFSSFAKETGSKAQDQVLPSDDLQDNPTDSYQLIRHHSQHSNNDLLAVDDSPLAEKRRRIKEKRLQQEAEGSPPKSQFSDQVRMAKKTYSKDEDQSSPQSVRSKLSSQLKGRFGPSQDEKRGSLFSKSSIFSINSQQSFFNPNREERAPRVAVDNCDPSVVSSIRHSISSKNEGSKFTIRMSLKKSEYTQSSNSSNSSSDELQEIGKVARQDTKRLSMLNPITEKVYTKAPRIGGMIINQKQGIKQMEQPAIKTTKAEYKIALKEECKGESDEIPSADDVPIHEVTHASSNFMKQEFFFLAKKKGNPVRDRMPPFTRRLKQQEKRWKIETKPSVRGNDKEKELFNKQIELQNTALQVLQQIEKSIDAIPLKKTQFSDDFIAFQQKVFEDTQKHQADLEIKKAIALQAENNKKQVFQGSGLSSDNSPQANGSVFSSALGGEQSAFSNLKKDISDDDLEMFQDEKDSLDSFSKELARRSERLSAQRVAAGPRKNNPPLQHQTSDVSFFDDSDMEKKDDSDIEAESQKYRSKSSRHSQRQNEKRLRFKHLQLPSQEITSSIGIFSEAESEIVKHRSLNSPGGTLDNQEIIALAQQLIDRNKELEKEKLGLIKNIKEKVQNGGHLVLERFNSFGRSNYKRQSSSQGSRAEPSEKSQAEASELLNNLSSILTDLVGQINDSGVNKQIVDLEKDLSQFKTKRHMQRKSQGPLSFKRISTREAADAQSSLKKYSSVNISASMSQKESEVSARQSGAESSNPEQLKKEHFKVLQETLEQKKLNQELLDFITKRMDQMMIEYNYGFLISLSIEEKKALKAQIEDIEKKYNEQEANKRKVQMQSSLDPHSKHAKQKQTNKPKAQETKFDRNRSMSFGSPCQKSFYQKKSDQLEMKKLQQTLFSGGQEQLARAESNESLSSEQRKNEIHEALKVDYSFFFQQKQGIFIAQAQMKYGELHRMMKKIDIEQQFKSVSDYETLTQQLSQEPEFSKKLTLIIDIENVFVTQINFAEYNEVVQEEDAADLRRKFIIVKRACPSKDKAKENINHCFEPTCRLSRIGNICQCRLKIYQIRPYTFEIINAILPFFELIGMSKIPFFEIQQIADHLEEVLNLPIQEKNSQTVKEIKEYKAMKKKLKKQGLDSSVAQRDRIGRFQPKILKKILYFQYVICQENYYHFDELDECLENFHVLTLNRRPSDIFYLSSNPLRLVAAMDQGFCSIPVSQFVKFNEDDFQLNLVENYLIKLQYYNDSKSKNMNDFGILMQKQNIEKYQKEAKKKEALCYKRKREDSIDISSKDSNDSMLNSSHFYDQSATSQTNSDNMSPNFPMANTQAIDCFAANVKASPAGQQLTEFVNRQSVKLDQKYAFEELKSGSEASSSSATSSSESEGEEQEGFFGEPKKNQQGHQEHPKLRLRVQENAKETASPEGRRSKKDKHIQKQNSHGDQIYPSQSLNLQKSNEFNSDVKLPHHGSCSEDSIFKQDPESKGTSNQQGHKPKPENKISFQNTDGMFQQERQEEEHKLSFSSPQRQQPPAAPYFIRKKTSQPGSPIQAEEPRVSFAQGSPPHFAADSGGIESKFIPMNMLIAGSGCNSPQRKKKSSHRKNQDKRVSVQPSNQSPLDFSGGGMKRTKRQSTRRY